MKGDDKMGLDMYMFRVRKLTDEEAAVIVGKRTNEISKFYSFICKDDFDSDPEPLADLLPYITQITAVDNAFDYNQCFIDHGINCRYIDEDHDMVSPEILEKFDRVVGSWCGPEGAGWSFASGARIEINKEEYDAYLYDRVVELYVWKSEDVGYWRKFYELDDFLQQIRVQERSKKYVEEKCCYPDHDIVKSWLTENCGYYLLSAEEKGKIKTFLKENEAPYSADLEDGCLDDDAAIMYHAWW
jgi:hypothetical protein